MLPRLISGLSEIASDHDALICDVWGVVHDGARHHPAAADALYRFKEKHGPVVLLTNAPRVPAEVAIQCTSYGLPPDCYDAIVSSGGAARDELERRVAGAGATNKKSTLPLYYIGPDRDLPMVAGLDIARTPIAEAQVALAIGLRDDMIETPDDYADELKAMQAKGLVMICANPDLVVHRGERLVYCAGSLAQVYEALGGQVIYYGKPHRPIYDSALAAAALAAKTANRQIPKRPLAVGDGLLTDIRGANGAGLEALFIADGVHGEETRPYTGEHLEALFTRFGAHARAVTRALKW
ncbi:MAG TPA: TIGR01459 family HAD-type hydrolase [Rhizomicrobium sp.]|jgi:HAD superfamily hydrolase (TIGR01459 family)|nr:TIGR01459 family HAD-type hydrolase [Rhizomicrobium sp.]